MFPLKGDQTYWTTLQRPGVAGGCTQLWGNPNTGYPGGKHNGIDLGCLTGTPVYAAWEGKVVKADYDSGYGRHVRILHPDGSLSLYGHFKQFFVKEGQEVAEGEYLGDSGGGMEDDLRGASDGPHLHWEVRSNPYVALSNIDPVAWLAALQTEEKLPPLSGTVVVVNEFINLRLNPGLNGRKLGKVLLGEEMQVAPGVDPVYLDKIEWTPLVFFVARSQDGVEFLRQKNAPPAG